MSCFKGTAEVGAVSSEGRPTWSASVRLTAARAGRPLDPKLGWQPRGSRAPADPLRRCGVPAWSRAWKSVGGMVLGRAGQGSPPPSSQWPRPSPKAGHGAQKQPPCHFPNAHVSQAPCLVPSQVVLWGCIVPSQASESGKMRLAERRWIAEATEPGRVTLGPV